MKIGHYLRRIGRFILFDEVRLMELFSAANLLAWADVLLNNPTLFKTPAYSGFSYTSAAIWAYIFGAIGLVQIGSTVMRKYFYEIRFTVMAFAAGAWTVVAWNFWQSGFSTTANLNYSLLALACGLSGVFLGWKNTSYLS